MGNPVRFLGPIIVELKKQETELEKQETELKNQEMEPNQQMQVQSPTLLLLRLRCCRRRPKRKIPWFTPSIYSGVVVVKIRT